MGVSLPLIGVPVLGPGHHQAAETSGSPGRSGCIRPSCWCCCPFPRGAAERSCGGGGDTCLCLMRAGTFTKGLWATCCLPLSAEEAAGGELLRSRGPGQGSALSAGPPSAPWGRGSAFWGTWDWGRAFMDGPASSGCLLVCLGWLWTTPAVWALVTLRSVMVCWGHRMAPTPALQPGLGRPQGSLSPEEGQVVCTVSPSVYTMS